LKSFDRSIAIDPAKIVVWHLKGILLLFMEEYQEALACLDTAIRLGLDDSWCWYLRGVALSRLGRHQEALDSADRSVYLNPDDPESHLVFFLRAAVLIDLRRFEEALDSSEKALRLNPQDSPSLDARGTCLASLDRLTEALTTFEESVEADPDGISGWILGAMTLSLMDRHTEAVQWAEKAVEIGTRLQRPIPHTVYALHVLGRIHLRMSMYADAKSDFYRSVCLAREGSDGPLISWCEGMFYLASGIEKFIKGRYPRAEADLQSALRLFKEAEPESECGLAEVLLAYSKIDNDIRKMACETRIETLRANAEETLKRMENSELDPDDIRTTVPQELACPILAKRTIIRLLVDVLNGRPLDEERLIGASLSLEQYLGHDWDQCVDRITIVLHSIANCKSLEEMKKREHEILRLTPDLLLVDGQATAQVLKRTGSLIDVRSVLVQYGERTRVFRVDFEDIPGPRVEDMVTAPDVRAMKPYFFTVWTEQGKHSGGEGEYADKYAKGPTRGGPLVWINLIGSDYSVRVGRKRIQVRIGPEGMRLLYRILRDFARLVPGKTLKDIAPNLEQSLRDLDKRLCGVFRPFLETRREQGRTLKRRGIKDRRRRFTFCLIEKYKALDDAKTYEPSYE
jgi:tetratricopeptide (TPR) repeat protein